MDVHDDPKAKKHFSGYPYYVVQNWEELEHALGMCTSPRIMGHGFHGSKLEYLEVCDDFIWNNEKYRFTEEVK